MTADNANRRRDLRPLEVELNAYTRLLDEELQGYDVALDPHLPDLRKNQVLLAGIERDVSAIQQDERRLLQLRSSAANRSSRRATWTILLGSTGGMTILLGTTLLLARTMRARRRAETTLRQNERRIRLMVDSVKDYAIIMLDAGGHILTWNTGAERMKGYRPQEIIGRHFSIFYLEESLQEGLPARELQETMRTGHFEDEGWRVRADGSRFLANVVFAAVRDDWGALLGFVKVTRDVTQARQTESEIRTLNHELKNRASALEAANKELEAFSYSVSHDLRAPLRHIGGFVELLQKAPALHADPACRRYTGVIAKASRQMGVLIDELLAFSRTGRIDMRAVPIDTRETLDQVISELEPDWKDRRVEWCIGDLQPIRGDPHLLRLVWMNLIGNALKYTRPRPVARIEIGQEESVESKPEATFYIRDNGVGFDMQYVHKLFGVFQRLHRAEEFEGTGIGLANVQRIVHRHGGRVWACGEPARPFASPFRWQGWSSLPPL